jgi:outer membrane biosynthesis protein TonB
VEEPEEEPAEEPVEELEEEPEEPGAEEVPGAAVEEVEESVEEPEEELEEEQEEEPEEEPVEEVEESPPCSDSKSVNHSTLDPDCHQEEPLKSLEEETLFSEQPLETESNNNSTSIKSPEPSSPGNSRTDLLISKMLEDLEISLSGKPTQDGGNNSDSWEVTW